MTNRTFKTSTQRGFKIVALFTAMTFSAFALGDDKSTAESRPVTAITKPSKESKLAFAGPGVITDVKVKEGDTVKAGQPLMVQELRMDELQYQSTKVEAESVDKINYSKTDLALKQVVLERKQKMAEDHVASPQELEEAKLAVDLAWTQVKLAEIEHAQKQMDSKRLEVKLELMQLASKFDGVVSKINSHEGEAADPQNRDGAIVVVNNDPLYIEMHLPTVQAAMLAMGQSLEVKYVFDKDWQPAKIIFFAPEADATSDTQLVRLELSNKAGKSSGLQMQVRLPANVAAASPERLTAMNP